MALTPMAEGGAWLQSPVEENIIYLAPKQYKGHFRRLVGDGWMPVADPRREEDQPKIIAQSAQQVSSAEMALRAEIDQLKLMVQMLIAQKSEQPQSGVQNEENLDQPNEGGSRRKGR